MIFNEEKLKAFQQKKTRVTTLTISIQYSA